ncbi:hypothetical protein KIU71_13500 [Alteromonas sp. SM 2104]|nr:hypothetical protein [Alteromonas oceanisediminis]
MLGCSTSPDVDTAAQASTINDTPAGMQVIDITGGAGGDRIVSADNSNSQDSDSAESFGTFGQPPVYSSVQGAYKGRPLTKHVGDYVKNLTQDLIGNMDHITTSTPIAVTHFALLDSNLQETNLLGQQMAESFVHELHKFRIPVVDYKATDYVRVTEAGDFILSRNYLELDTELPMDYVLTGTMTKHQGGYLVNARVLGFRTKNVVASAQMLLPFYVVDALIPSESSGNEVSGTVKLKKG